MRPVSGALDAIVLRCLAHEPGARYASAALLADDIAAAYDANVGTDLAIAAVVRGLFAAG